MIQKSRKYLIIPYEPFIKKTIGILSLEYDIVYLDHLAIDEDGYSYKYSLSLLLLAIHPNLIEDLSMNMLIISKYLIEDIIMHPEFDTHVFMVNNDDRSFIANPEKIRDYKDYVNIHYINDFAHIPILIKNSTKEEDNND